MSVIARNGEGGHDIRTVAQSAPPSGVLPRTFGGPEGHPAVTPRSGAFVRGDSYVFRELAVEPCPGIILGSFIELIF